MNVHFSYKLSKTPDIETTIDQQVQKLWKRLQIFKPDMMSLRGTVEDAPKNAYAVSLNLRLPSGQMAARCTSPTIEGAVKSCFEDLLEQVIKHKDHLRAHGRYPRQRRPDGNGSISQVPFESTVAAVQTPKISAEDIAQFVNTNLGRLRRFVLRELLFRSNNQQKNLLNLSVEEVIDEAIASALDDNARPEKITLEPWLYRMARSAIDRLANQSHTKGGVALEGGRSEFTDNGDDDAMVHFRGEDEIVTNENVIADKRLATPEDLFAGEEILEMIETALRGARVKDREAFTLHFFEGFTAQEIATITDRPVEDVHISIKNARDHIRQKLPIRELAPTLNTARSGRG